MLIKARAYSKKNYVTIQSTLRKETSCSTKHHLKWSLQRTWICTYNGMHSWQGNRYSPTPRTQSTFHNSTTGFPAKLHLRNQCQNSILMAHHCPDLCISTNQNQIWALMCPWYGISALPGSSDIIFVETSGGIKICWLFSQAILLLSVSRLICIKSLGCTWEVCQALKKLKLPSITPWATLSFWVASFEHQ